MTAELTGEKLRRLLELEPNATSGTSVAEVVDVHDHFVPAPAPFSRMLARPTEGITPPPCRFVNQAASRCGAMSVALAESNRGAERRLA